MENPKLIEEISNLGKGTASAPEEKAEEISGEIKADAQRAVSASPEPTVRQASGKNRSQLLGALKPYVSTERAQAIDSMLSIVEILDAMKGR